MDGLYQSIQNQLKWVEEAVRIWVECEYLKLPARCIFKPERSRFRVRGLIKWKEQEIPIEWALTEHHDRHCFTLNLGQETEYTFDIWIWGNKCEGFAVTYLNLEPEKSYSLKLHRVYGPVLEVTVRNLEGSIICEDTVALWNNQFFLKTEPNKGLAVDSPEMAWWKTLQERSEYIDRTQLIWITIFLQNVHANPERFLFEDLIDQEYAGPKHGR